MKIRAYGSKALQQRDLANTTRRQRRRENGVATFIYGNMTPFPRHSHVLFDVAWCLLNLSNNKFTWCFHKAKQVYCIHHANVQETYCINMLYSRYCTISSRESDRVNTIYLSSVLYEEILTCTL